MVDTLLVVAVGLVVMVAMDFVVDILDLAHLTVVVDIGNLLWHL